ncbi:hypothetical protein C8F01DRAFT_757649 [Mycena amicta]|nr:hypothetical protein C8F01DRAFT_757649 [Mycena amicta]
METDEDVVKVNLDAGNSMLENDRRQWADDLLIYLDVICFTLSYTLGSRMTAGMPPSSLCTGLRWGSSPSHRPRRCRCPGRCDPLPLGAFLPLPLLCRDGKAAVELPLRAVVESEMQDECSVDRPVSARASRLQRAARVQWTEVRRRNYGTRTSCTGDFSRLDPRLLKAIFRYLASLADISLASPQPCQTLPHSRRVCTPSSGFDRATSPSTFRLRRYMYLLLVQPMMSVKQAMCGTRRPRSRTGLPIQSGGTMQQDEEAIWLRRRRMTPCFFLHYAPHMPALHTPSLTSSYHNINHIHLSRSSISMYILSHTDIPYFLHALCLWVLTYPFHLAVLESLAMILYDRQPSLSTSGAIPSRFCSSIFRSM